MSCVDVMYQPYASYFPYQRAGSTASSMDPFKKLGFAARIHEASMANLEGSTGAFTSHTGSSGLGTLQPASSGSNSPISVVTKREAGELDKDLQPQTTQYVSGNCVLFTYFSGDISTNVDDHFSRALSQPSSFNPDQPASKSSSSWKGASPTMSQRNFPPSFWNSSYHSQCSSSSSTSSQHHHQDLHSLTDPYAHVTSALHGMGPLHHQDPWRYPLSSQTHGYTHHGMPHDFPYTSVASSGRFNPHYSSLLSSGRLGTLPGQCDPLSKHTDTWTSRYHHDPLGSGHLSGAHNAHFAAASLGGIETAVQESGKDLYWF